MSGACVQIMSDLSWQARVYQDLFVHAGPGNRRFHATRGKRSESDDTTDASKHPEEIQEAAAGEIVAAVGLKNVTPAYAVR